MTLPTLDLEPVVDHEVRLAGFVPSQFRRMPVAGALISAIGRSLQTVEDDHFDLWVSSQLEVAAGPLLDQWGLLVGEPRGGLDDEEYRVFIMARILVNLTDSNGLDVQTIAETITAPSTVRIYPYSTYGYQVVIVRESFMSGRRAARVGRFLRMTKPGGVPIDITEQRPGDFGFLEDPDALPFGIGPLARSL